MYESFEKQVFGNPIGCDHKDSLWGESNGRWFKLNTQTEVISVDFLVQPNDIREGVRSHGLFGRDGIEDNASRLITYAQQRGEWRSFTAEEVVIDEYGLDWLAGMGFVRKNDDGTYDYTVGLVMEFYFKYPALKQVAT